MITSTGALFSFLLLLGFLFLIMGIVEEDLFIILIVPIAIFVCVLIACSYCDDVTSTVYAFDNVTCDTGVKYDCGYELSDCSDGNQYDCVNNVKVIKEEEECKIIDGEKWVKEE